MINKNNCYYLIIKMVYKINKIMSEDYFLFKQNTNINQNEIVFLWIIN